MTENDKIPFSKIMLYLGVAFGSSPSKKLMAIYYEALRPCSIESLEWAAKECVAKLKFFPRAAELRDFASIAPIQRAKLPAPAEQKQLERLTPLDEVREKLAELSRRLNGEFDTAFTVQEVNGRPTMVSERDG